mgnify:FL=1
MLDRERNSDDGDRADQREHQVGARDLEAHAHEPDRVDDDGERSQAVFKGIEFATKGSEAERRELEALNSERDADDRNAKREAVQLE